MFHKINENKDVYGQEFTRHMDTFSLTEKNNYLKEQATVGYTKGFFRVAL